MSNYIKKNFDVVFNSNPLSGASNVSTDGSRFTASFNAPIRFPKEAKNCNFKVSSGNVWYSHPNISSDLNNNVLTVQEGVTVYTVTLPSGNYSVSELSDAIDRDLTEQGATAGIVTLSADTASQRVELNLSQTDVKVTFGANSPYTVMGFNLNDVVGPFAVSPNSELAPARAQFNNISNYLIKADFSQGIQYNNSYSGTIAVIDIDTAPGNQILYRPVIPSEIPCDNLRGSSLNSVTLSLTDELNQPVQTAGETWGCRLTFAYMVPL